MRADLERGRPRPSLVFPVQSRVTFSSRNRVGASSSPPLQSGLAQPQPNSQEGEGLGIELQQGGAAAKVKNAGTQSTAADTGPIASRRGGSMVLDYSKWDRILSASENEDSAEERAPSPSNRVGVGIDVDTGQVGGEHVAWAEKRVHLAGEQRSCRMSLTFSWCRCSVIAQNARVHATLS